MWQSCSLENAFTFIELHEVEKINGEYSAVVVTILTKFHSSFRGPEVFFVFLQFSFFIQWKNSFYQRAEDIIYFLLLHEHHLFIQTAITFFFENMFEKSEFRNCVKRHFQKAFFFKSM